MSAWPQAVWIVRKLQKNFDFTEKIIEYATEINSLNGRVNDLNITLQRDEDRLSDIEQNIKIITSTIRDTKDNTTNLPSHYSSDEYDEGTIWLIVKSL